jgi:hypothetical protein
MMKTALCTILVLTLPILPLAAQTPETQRDLDAVLGYLKQHQAGSGDVKGKSDSILQKVFPDTKLFVVRWRVYPVAQLIPEGFRASNVLAVTKEGKVIPMKDRDALKRLLHDHAAVARSAGELKDLLTAWFTLSQEQYQDGFYKFEIPHKDMEVNKERTQIRGRAVAVQGGSGEISATLELSEGKLAMAIERSNLRPGPRPIGR